MSTVAIGSFEQIYQGMFERQPMYDKHVRAYRGYQKLKNHPCKAPDGWAQQLIEDVKKGKSNV